MPEDNPFEVLNVNEQPVAAFEGTFQRCPRCQSKLHSGFAPGVGFISDDGMKSILCRPQSIQPNPSWSSMFFDSLRYFPASLFRQCGCFLIDGSQSLGYRAARKLAQQRSQP